jgi:hypothetical protein
MTLEQQLEFYIANQSKLTYGEMRKALKISSNNLTKLIKDNNLGKKDKVYKEKVINTKFFSWEWAATFDPIMSLS